MNEQVIHMILEGIRDTLYMTLSSVVIGYAFGLPFGILLYTTGKNGLLPQEHPFFDPLDSSDPFHKVSRWAELRFYGDHRAVGGLRGSLHCESRGVLIE